MAKSNNWKNELFEKSDSKIRNMSINNVTKRIKCITLLTQCFLSLRPQFFTRKVESGTYQHIHFKFR